MTIDASCVNINIMKRLDLIHQRFSNCIVLSFYGPSSSHKSQWKCLCDCGNEFIALGSELLSGHTKSCGCYSRSGTFTTTHGQRSYNGTGKPSVIYNLWINIVQRCINPNHPYFCDYGKRGISVCQQWKDSFKTFSNDISATTGEKPPLRAGYKRYWSIDRINNDGNYEIGNVRWSDPTTQKLNQRKRRWWKKPKGE